MLYYHTLQSVKIETVKNKYGSKCLKLPKSSRNAIKKFRTFDFYTLQSVIVKQRYLYSEFNFCSIFRLLFKYGGVIVSSQEVLVCRHKWSSRAFFHPMMGGFSPFKAPSFSCMMMCVYLKFHSKSLHMYLFALVILRTAKI